MAKNTTEATNPRPDEAQIQEWKKKHRVLHEITSQCGEYVCIVRQPKLMDLERALKADKAPKAKPLDYNRILLTNITLYIDPGFRDDDGRETSLLTSVGEVTAIEEATVKKL